MADSPAPFDHDAAVTEYRVLIKQRWDTKTPKAKAGVEQDAGGDCS